MESRLIEYGDSVALVLDRATLDQLNITMDTPLDISVEGSTITINPLRRKAGPEDIKDALERVNQRYSRMLKRLAE